MHYSPCSPLKGGKLSFRATPDFETPKDADQNNVYKLELKATDAAGNTGKKVLSITVMNVDGVVISLPASLRRWVRQIKKH